MAVNGVSCTSLSHASAMHLIDASGNQLVLTVRRYGPFPSVQVSHYLSQLCASLAWLQQLTIQVPSSACAFLMLGYTSQSSE